MIDDFHRLAAETQAELANIAKLAAESGQSEQAQTTLVLIGIHQVGSQLIQLVPDVAKRAGIHCIRAGTRPDIERLIQEGSVALNVHIRDAVLSLHRNPRRLLKFTQQLCQTICTINEVLETLKEPRTIH